ncbi:MAG: insulinase family protein [Bdellovibrionaceae bacterium]|nr:insulinase family protein [Pseudobdellovibrionaceae bacterium]
MYFVNVIFLSILLLIKPNISAATTHESFKINGFEVHLIDVAKGNKLAMQYIVPVGSRMDPSHLAGRAHFLEHMVLKGSHRYPGYNTQNELSAKIGALGNASTDLGKTEHYLIVKDIYAQQGIDLFFAGLAGPEFKPEVLAHELTAVENEINKEFVTKPFVNLVYSNVDVLPEGHPLKRWDLGTTDILANMRVEDLKQLFYGTYAPEFVKVVIAGNFSNGKLDKKTLKKWLKSSLVPTKLKNDKEGFVLTEKPAVLSELPSLVSSTEPLPFLEYKAKDSSRMGMHLIDNSLAEFSGDLLALDYLNMYLESTASGSLASTLKEKGWCNGVTIDTKIASGRIYYSVFFNYTKAGWNHREEILESFYQALLDVKEKGIDDYTLGIIKGLMLDNLTESFKSAPGAMNAFTGLLETKNVDILNLDFSKALEKVNSKDVQELVLRFFNPLKSVNVFISPDVVSNGYSQAFSKKYRKFKNNKLLNKLADSLAQKKDLSINQVYKPNYVVVPEFKTNTTPLPMENSDWVTVGDSHSGLVSQLKEDHSDVNGAFQFTSYLDILNNYEAQVAAIVYLMAFKDSISEVRTVLRSRAIYIDVSINGNQLVWSGDGEAQSLNAAFQYVADLFMNYKPSAKQLKTALEIYKSNIINGISSSFIGSLAKSYTLSAVSGFANYEQASELAKAMTPTKIKNLFSNFTLNGQSELLVLGDYSAEDVLAFRSSASNGTQNKIQVSNIKAPKYAKDIQQVENVNIQLPQGKDINTVGIARIYTGPELINLKENAIATLLGKFLHSKVFNLNRSERGLGYVHGASTNIIGDHKQFSFYGQIDDPERLSEVQEGWEQVMQALRNRALDDVELENYKMGVVSDLTFSPYSLLEEVHRAAFNYQMISDFNYVDNVIEEVKKLTPDDIFNFANKYFKPETPYYEVQIKNCSDALTEQ